MDKMMIREPGAGQSLLYNPLYHITAKIISGGRFRLPNQDKLKRQNDLSCNLFILVLSVTIMTYVIITLFK